MILATTFTPYYCEAEDRIRLVINYADFSNRVDFWITRAFLLKLLPSMEQYLYTYAVPDIMNTPNTAKSTNTSATDGGTLAVMEKEGILLETVNMAYVSDSGLFEIKMQGKGVEITAVLNEQMMMALIKSIFAAAPHIIWGISSHMLDYK